MALSNMLKLLVFLHLNMLLTGVCQKSEVQVKAGDMAVLKCPFHRERNHNEVKWSSPMPWGPNLTNNLPPAEQLQMGVLVEGENLVILNVSQNHQGNYSCSVSNVTGEFWQRLLVTSQSRKENQTCYAQTACTLYCPKVAVQSPNITAGDVIWNEEILERKYFPEVMESHSGLYKCTRTYRYHGQLYNMSFALELNVKPDDNVGKTPAITSPQKNETFYVDLDSPVVIDCKALTYGDEEIEDLYWLNGDSFVPDDTSQPVYYNYSWETATGVTRRRASLIIQRASKEDFSRNYKCNLAVETGEEIFVTITLRPKPLPPSPPLLPLAISIFCTAIIITVPALIFVKFKVEMTLFLRDTVGCHRRGPDGKSHDVFLMCYQADTDVLKEPDSHWIASVLEEGFGYSLCLDDRDPAPGTAVAEAVLECIEQSRTVLLVPTSSEPCLGSGLLSAIHEALVERQTRLVFIKMEAAGVPASASEPEALQLLCEAANCVTWRGSSSMPTSSSFWKKLRYYLPAPQQEPKMILLEPC